MPTLREVLARYRVPLIIELKTPEAALARAHRSTRSAPPTRSAAWRSVPSTSRVPARGASATSRASPPAPRARRPAGRSTGPGCSWPLGRPAFREFQVPERSGRTTIVTPRFVSHAHRAGLPVKVWTVNARADIDRLLSWGVDAIISDRPDVAVAALRASSTRLLKSERKLASG